MLQNTANPNRDICIDLLKVLAILGVIILHNDSILYHSRYISTLARFALPLFLFVGGYNIFNSFSKKTSPSINSLLKKILLPYLVATIISCCIIQKEFNASHILYALLHFSATYPLYYVILYLELLFCSIFITRLLIYGRSLTKTLKKVFFYILLCSLVYIICLLNTHYTVMFQWGFWSRMLFGGPMFMIWFIGMLCASLDIKKTSKKLITFFIILSFLGIVIFCLSTFTGIIYTIPNICGYIDNTFTILDVIYVCSIFTFIKGLGTLCKNKKNTLIHKLITYVGMRTYYIFLYHIVFQIITTQWIIVPNIRLKRLVVFLSMLIGPLIIEFLFAKLKMFSKHLKQTQTDKEN